MLILEEPKRCAVLSRVYKCQQLRLQAIVDDLMEIEELSDVSTNSLYDCMFSNIIVDRNLFDAHVLLGLSLRVMK